jgi:hypothetical protein
MTSLATAPLDPDQLDMLALLADEHTPLGIDLADRFRDACRAEAEAHDGWVHPSNVTGRLKAQDPGVNTRRVSALWSTATSRDGYLDNTDRPARLDGSVSKGNGNKHATYRRWRGWNGSAA